MYKPDLTFSCDQMISPQRKIKNTNASHNSGTEKSQSLPTGAHGQHCQRLSKTIYYPCCVSSHRAAYTEGSHLLFFSCLEWSYIFQSPAANEHSSTHIAGHSPPFGSRYTNPPPPTTSRGIQGQGKDNDRL